jgi:hypothetical protein
MCVILVCPPNIRPSREVLSACAFANPDGAGFAWKCGPGSLAYEKGLEAEELPEALESVPASAELVIHFRLTSQGPTHPSLCHPFPVRRTPASNAVAQPGSSSFTTALGPPTGRPPNTSTTSTRAACAGLYSDTYVIAAIVARRVRRFSSGFPDASSTSRRSASVSTGTGRPTRECASATSSSPTGCGCPIRGSLA